MSVINYKVRARGKWDWRLFDTVRMEISVGQPYHEDEKLKATMDWARENFKNRFIILGDTTQRFNIMFREGIDEESAFNKSQQLGDEWLKRNFQYLDGIHVTRWEDWKNHSDYHETHTNILKYYQSNQVFASSIMGAALAFWSRQDLAESEKMEFLRNSEKYLLEETSVFAVAYRELGGISAYPGTFLELWEMFINDHNPDVPEGLKHGQWARLSYEKKKQKVA